MKKISNALILTVLLASPAIAAENGGFPNFFTNEAPPALADTPSGEEAAAIEPAAGPETDDEENGEAEATEESNEAPAGPPSGPVDEIGEEPAAKE